MLIIIIRIRRVGGIVLLQINQTQYAIFTAKESQGQIVKLIARVQEHKNQKAKLILSPA